MNKAEIEQLNQRIQALEEQKKVLISENTGPDVLEISIGYVEQPTIFYINGVELASMKIQNMNGLKTKMFGIVKNYPGAIVKVTSHLPRVLVEILKSKDINAELGEL